MLNIRNVLLSAVLLAAGCHPAFAQLRIVPAQLPTLDQNELVGRNAAGTGDQTALTATQVRTLLNVVEGSHIANTDAESKCTGTNVLEGSGACVANAGGGGISNVVEDTTPQLGGDLDINSKAFTGEYTAAVTLADGDLVYMNSSGKMALMDADAEATTKGMLAIATEAITVDTTGSFVLMGNYTTTGLTTGSTYYVSVTAGDFTTTAPSATGDQLRIVGYATSTTNLFVNASQLWVELP